MSRADHYAVVVGKTVYPGFDQRDLEGPVNDAFGFIDWLKAPTGGDLPAGNIQHLLSSQPPAASPRPLAAEAHPSADEIDALFRPLYEQGQDTRVRERLYIMVAGHGISDRFDLRSVALQTANATASDPLHVAMVKRAEWFRRHAAFDENDEQNIVFSDVSATRAHAVQVWIQPHTGRETLVVSQNFNQVARVPSATSPQTVHLVPGIYKLEIGGSDRSKLIEVPRDDECVL